MDVVDKSLLPAPARGLEIRFTLSVRPFPQRNVEGLGEACCPEGLHQERGWESFMLLTRLLLHKPLRRGNVPRYKLVTRFEIFAQGHWGSRIRDSVDSCKIAQSR